MQESRSESTAILCERIERPSPGATFEDHVDYLLRCRRMAERYAIARIKEMAESPIECIAALYLWDWSSGDNRVRLFLQKQIGKYRVDFAVEYGDVKIVIECDGHEFHEKTKEQAARDKKRDRYLASQGYTVLRYTGSEIVKNPAQIIDDIMPLIDPDIAELLREE
ncbi:MAG: endonuclease domain-containing protein [Alicyclobacillus sp.]|nr:endonuclease domain-containing protein [Alicyclobacillus sp.]